MSHSRMCVSSQLHNLLCLVGKYWQPESMNLMVTEISCLSLTGFNSLLVLILVLILFYSAFVGPSFSSCMMLEGQGHEEYMN